MYLRSLSSDDVDAGGVGDCFGGRQPFHNYSNEKIVSMLMCEYLIV